MPISPAKAHERAKKARAAQSTPQYHVSRIRAIVDRSRAEQGLPPHVTDPLTLSAVADILRLSAHTWPT